MKKNNPARPKTESDSEQSSSDEEPVSSRRKRSAPIDESTLDEEEARKLEARRAYNRMCAAKARKRSKDLISRLQNQVEELTKDKAALERANEVMKAQLELLEQQNRTLIMNQRQNIPAGGIPPGMLGGGAPPFLMTSAAAGYPGLFDSLASQSRLGISSTSSALAAGSLPGGPQSQGKNLDPKFYLS